jgi:hypothetical protein
MTEKGAVEVLYVLELSWGLSVVFCYSCGSHDIVIPEMTLFIHVFLNCASTPSTINSTPSSYTTIEP